MRNNFFTQEEDRLHVYVENLKCNIMLIRMHHLQMENTADWTVF